MIDLLDKHEYCCRGESLADAIARLCSLLNPSSGTMRDVRDLVPDSTSPIVDRAFKPSILRAYSLGIDIFYAILVACEE